MKRKIAVFAVVGLLATSYSGVAFADDTNNLTQNSNATFAVDAKTDPTNPEDGSITLASVPSFDFGTVKSSEIYAGFIRSSSAVTNDVVIKDYRPSSASGWTLSASRNDFNGLTAGSSLTFATGKSSVGNLSVNGTIRSDGSSTTLGSGGDNLHGVFTMPVTSSALSVGANPSAAVTDGQTLTSNITWNLTGSAPSADSLK